MKDVSWKPAVYLVDGSNFYMSVFCGDFMSDRSAAEKKFAAWVKFVSENVEELADSTFRVYLDGGFRDLSGNTPKVAFIFSESAKADEGLLEYASFCASEKRRAIAVSNDRELVSEIKKMGIKTLNCGKFFRMFEKKLK
ncbi:MAG: hypothetical protein COT17_07260 [Elusimicrobia bacterium CG08_land_8_20_14_0_20_51_18]|nr:MAG: hypothetical protein COT17_07260 [Elusimicrobia bacterium CG08_land_8_20_14_0_20_51_18]